MTIRQAGPRSWAAEGKTSYVGPRAFSYNMPYTASIEQAALAAIADLESISPEDTLIIEILS